MHCIQKFSYLKKQVTKLGKWYTIDRKMSRKKVTNEFFIEFTVSKSLITISFYVTRKLNLTNLDEVI